MLLGSLQSPIIFQLLTLLLLDSFYSVEGTALQSPSFACAGDSITVSCVLTVPDAGAGDVFDSTRPNFIIGPTDVAVTENDVIGTGTSNGFNLSRFTADTNPGSLTEVSGSISLLSYINNTDEGLRLGCINTYRAGGSGAAIPFMQALTLVQAAPPSAPSIQSISPSNIDPNTCSATVSLNWTAPSSTNRTVNLYYLSLQNGTALDSISAPANSSSHNTTPLLDTVYAYSVHASSCAGNSTLDTSHLNPINSYSLMAVNPMSNCLSYDNTSSVFTFDWVLSSENTPLLVQYSLQYNYSYSQGNATTPSNGNTITLFSNLSSVLTHDQSIPPHNFPTTEGIDTNITACLKIVSQCGQSQLGTEICCSFSSRTPVILFPSTTTSIPTPISTPISTSALPPVSTSTSGPRPTSPPIDTPALNTGAIIGGAIGGIILILIIMVILLILLGICICFLKKRDSDPKESDRYNMRDFDANQSSRESVDKQPEATYSQVNKTPKPEQPLYADINKPQKELLYADLEHVAPASGMVKPPTVPSTHYADLAQFSHSEQTTYATVQDTKY